MRPAPTSGARKTAEVVSPPRLVICNALVAIVLVAQQYVLDQFLHYGFVTVRGRKTDRILRQFPSKERFRLPFVAVPGTTAFALAVDENPNRGAISNHD